jgi:hypothetical protein
MAMLSIAEDLDELLDANRVINKFACAKTHKKNILGHALPAFG